MRVLVSVAGKFILEILRHQRPVSICISKLKCSSMILSMLILQILFQSVFLSITRRSATPRMLRQFNAVDCVTQPPNAAEWWFSVKQHIRIAFQNEQRFCFRVRNLLLIIKYSKKEKAFWSFA